MVQAYILIQTRPGTGPRVTKEVSNVKGVGSAFEVPGPYEVIARAEARSLAELSKQALGDIEAVAGVIRTLTCTVADLYKQASLLRSRGPEAGCCQDLFVVHVDGRSQSDSNT